MSTESYLSKSSEPTRMNPSSQHAAAESDGFRKLQLAHKVRQASSSTLFLFGKHLSPWSRSRSKRVFDCVCVLSMLPILIPVFLLVGLAVRLTSHGPVLFLQKRMGRHGKTFTILKFRTMVHNSGGAHKPVTTSGNQFFTPVGPFLRRWKLDELPQVFNVLAGHMSLVGPRPKLEEHAISNLPCRAGITGAATLTFAREEAILDRVPKQQLETFYHSVVLPAKHRIDAEYMAHATFRSDFRIIVDSVLRRWDSTVMENLLKTWAFEHGDKKLLSSLTDSENAFAHAHLLAQMERPASAEEIGAF